MELGGREWLHSGEQRTSLASEWWSHSDKDPTTRIGGLARSFLLVTEGCEGEEISKVEIGQRGLRSNRFLLRLWGLSFVVVVNRRKELQSLGSVEWLDLAFRWVVSAPISYCDAEGVVWRFGRPIWAWSFERPAVEWWRRRLEFALPIVVVVDKWWRSRMVVLVCVDRSSVGWNRVGALCFMLLCSWGFFFLVESRWLNLIWVSQSETSRSVFNCSLMVGSGKSLLKEITTDGD